MLFRNEIFQRAGRWTMHKATKSSESVVHVACTRIYMQTHSPERLFRARVNFRNNLQHSRAFGKAISPSQKDESNCMNAATPKVLASVAEL